MGSHPHFFKIILPPTLTEKRLSLPLSFVREYGDFYPSNVLIRLPNGKEWRMELIIENGRAQLNHGWQEFAEYYGLEIGHLLVFKFDKNSLFSVLIFDKSAREIKYPSNVETIILSESENDDSVEILDHLSKKTGEKPSIHCSQPLKKIKSEKAALSDRRKSISRCEKIKAFERASAFKSRNPFFKIVLQPSSFPDGNNMWVSSEFAEKYFPTKPGDCTFSIENGRTWHVSYKNSGPRSRIRIVSGFKEFVRDNDLKIGDVCVFELVQIKQLSFKVSVFPANTDEAIVVSSLPGRGECSRSTGNNSLTRKIEDKDVPPSPVSRLPGRGECSRPIGNNSLKRKVEDKDAPPSPVRSALNFTSLNPNFRISIFPSHAKGKSFLSIPRSFTDTCTKVLGIKCIQDAVLQASDGRRWPAKLHLMQNDGKIDMRINCRMFVLANKLKAGDVCVFELIKDVQILLNVQIFRASKRQDIRYFEEALEPSQICRNSTENSFFELVINSSMITYCHMNLFGEFKNYLVQSSAETVKLLVGDRAWAMRVKKYRSSVRLSAGWPAFYRDNAIQVDDMCKFELVDPKNNVLKVSIFRSDNRLCG